MAQWGLSCMLLVLVCEGGLATCRFAFCIYIWNIGVLLEIAKIELPKNFTTRCET